MNVTKNRFLNRHGFGVHSPWAYDMIVNVIEERLPYYAYDDLYEFWEKAPDFLPQYEDRDDELLFRLVNAQKPRFILEVGTGAGVSTGYLASVSSKTPCVTLDEKHSAVAKVRRNLARFPQIDYRTGDIMTNMESVAQENPLDFVVIAHTDRYEEVADAVLKHANPHTLLVIEGISTKGKKALWKKLEEDDRTGVTILKGRTGLIFFDLKMYPHHYLL